MLKHRITSAAYQEQLIFVHRYARVELVSEAEKKDTIRYGVTPFHDGNLTFRTRFLCFLVFFTYSCPKQTFLTGKSKNRDPESHFWIFKAKSLRNFAKTRFFAILFQWMSFNRHDLTAVLEFRGFLVFFPDWKYTFISNLKCASTNSKIFVINRALE